MKKTMFLSLALTFSTVAGLFAQGNGTARDRKELAADRQETRIDQRQGDRADFEFKQFSGQTRRLRDAVLKAEPNKMAALQVSLVRSMRQQINQVDAQIAQAKNELVLSKAEKKSETKDVQDSRADGQPKEAADDRRDRRDDRQDVADDARDLDEKQAFLLKMKVIMADFEAFTFKIDNATEAEIKLKLCDEFGQMMHKNMVSIRREEREDKREVREDKRERREDQKEKREKK